MFLTQSKKILEKKRWTLPLILILVNIFTWYPALNFWFFRAWEPGWLISACGEVVRVSFTCLYQSHGWIYYLNYLLFGWNPWGWYFTAIAFHILATLLVYWFTKKIFKKGLIAFVVALVFSINITHHDVVNWGSFEAQYAVMLSLYLGSLLFYDKYLNSKRSIWLIVSALVYYPSLLFREISIILPFLIITYDLYRNGFVVNKINFKRLAVSLFPFAVVTIVHLIFRYKTGGVPVDAVDAGVQYRRTIFAQGLWWEYFKRSLFSFGKFSAAHIVPYTWLNQLRELLAGRFNTYLVNYYFFSVLGFIYFSFISVVAIYFFLTRKLKFRNEIVFSYLWFLIPTVFYSLVFTMDDIAILKPYVWDASRWRYFAFVGTAAFWVSLGLYIMSLKKLKSGIKKLILVLPIIAVFINVYVIREVQGQMYKEDFLPAKNFYTTFLKDFRDLKEGYYFYIFPNAFRLNDFISEWYLIRAAYNPDLKEVRRDWAENSFEMLLERLVNENISLENVYFLDMDDNGKVVNQTETARKLIQEQAQKSYRIRRNMGRGFSEDFTIIDLDPKLSVETPYLFELGFIAQKSGLKSDPDLDSFTSNWIQFMKDSKVSVCATAPLGSQGRPAEHLVPVHLIDGNLGLRSIWVADCRRPAWITLDLGKSKGISGFAFSGRDGEGGMPLAYNIQVSNDGDSWSQVLQRRNNELGQRIEIFPMTRSARYFKFEVEDTLRGAFLELDEISLISEDNIDFVSTYGNDFRKLLKESYETAGFIELSWETQPDDNEVNKKVYVPIIADNKFHKYIIEPNESEIYSSPSDFLKRFIKSVKIRVISHGFDVFLQDFRVYPKYKL